MDDISVLICDDSALMRNLISRIIAETPGLSVSGKAMNGQFALDKIPVLHPDILILDIEMPVMSGVEFLHERKIRHWDIPVIILSSIATKGAAVTMQCLELGASDFITKPNGSVSSDLSSVSEQLIEMISSYGGAYARIHGKNPYTPDFFMHQAKMRQAELFVAKQKGGSPEAVVPKTAADKTELHPALWNTPEKKEPAVIEPLRDGGPIKLIALGISTGGPNALREIFKLIDPHLKQPILVVQHMPAGFTSEFANSLNRICPLTVTEAKDGDKIEDAHIYIAPGDYHIFVERSVMGPVIRLSHGAARNGHRPSADVLFESVAKEYKNDALGVIMTGMGRDGAAELAEMRRQGAWTLGQDQKSSIVYGMPKVAWELGGVQKQVSLDAMADEISALARTHSF
ncbi:MAG: chemotaxis response regulator protein-glutamate methylesterase [Treponema sp.]|nr:chemotaxis response regulator protein-glutamate methylesterase [Treponema sp.]